MNKKVTLILIDGMRPDGLLSCGNSYVDELLKKSSYSLDAKTVMPSVTLPCHMSLFHSVTPERHGTTTNTYAPQVRPVEGLFGILHRAGITTGMFYNWEELRDISRPGDLTCSFFMAGHDCGYEKSNRIVTEEAIKFINKNDSLFSFVYLGDVDEIGHKHGWMGKEYLNSVNQSINCVKDITENCGGTVIITADHGGHERMHGTELDEDMTIPMILNGGEFAGGKKLCGISILDIAPTVAAIMGCEPSKDWEGKNILNA